MPASWLSGAMVAVTAALVGRLDTRLPVPLVEFSFLLIGIALGAGLTPELLRGLGAWPFSLASCSLTVVAVTVGRALVPRPRFGLGPRDRVLRRRARCAVLCHRRRGDDRRRHPQGGGEPEHPHLPAHRGAAGDRRRARRRAPSGPPVTTASWEELALLVAVSTVVGFAFRYLRVPAGLLTGSFAASAFLHGSGLVKGTLPEPVVIAAFILLGALVGSRFVGTSLGFLARILVPSFGAFLVATAIAFVAALIVAAVAGIAIDQAIVAFAPGGLDAMMSLALALHMDTAFVAAHQFARFAGIAFGLPFFLRWARGRGKDV